jgi:hypothetical protein
VEPSLQKMLYRRELPSVGEVPLADLARNPMGPFKESFQTKDAAVFNFTCRGSVFWDKEWSREPNGTAFAQQVVINVHVISLSRGYTVIRQNYKIIAVLIPGNALTCPTRKFSSAGYCGDLT